jgi:hypothetical protein
VPIGVKTESQQSLNYSQFVSPTTQPSLTVSHDVAVLGQFKQDQGLMDGVAKVF